MGERANDMSLEEVRERYSGIFDDVHLLGEGSYGRVYRAVDTETDLPVAVKVLDRSKLSPSEEQATRRELEVLTRVTRVPGEAECAHPGVVCYYGSHQTPQYLVVVMQLIEGRTLRDWVLEVYRAGGKVADAQAQVLCAQLLSALAFVHAQGVAHRDIKPANIMIRGRGDVRTQYPQPVLIDFGVACQTVARGRAARTRAGAAPCLATPSTWGSPLFLGPAQWDYGSLRDPPYTPPAVLQRMQAGDVWALGVSLFMTVHVAERKGRPRFQYPFTDAARSRIPPSASPTQKRALELETLRDAIQKNPLKPPTRTGPAVIQALQAMLTRAYLRRPTAAALTTLFFAPRQVELTVADAQTLQALLQEERRKGAIRAFAMDTSATSPLPPTASFVVELELAPQASYPPRLPFGMDGARFVMFAHKIINTEQRGVYQLWSAPRPLPSASPPLPSSPAPLAPSPVPSSHAASAPTALQAQVRAAWHAAQTARKVAQTMGSEVMAARDAGSPLQAGMAEAAVDAAATSVSTAARLAALLQAAGPAATREDHARANTMYAEATALQAQLDRYVRGTFSLRPSPPPFRDATDMSLEDTGAAYQAARAEGVPAWGAGAGAGEGEEDPYEAAAREAGLLDTQDEVVRRHGHGRLPPAPVAEEWKGGALQHLAATGTPLSPSVLAAVAAEDARLETTKAEAAARAAEGAEAQVRATLKRMRAYQAKTAAAQGRAARAEHGTEEAAVTAAAHAEAVLRAVSRSLRGGRSTGAGDVNMQ